VLTTGDNNYWGGGCGSLQENIGQYFREWLGPTGTCDGTTPPPAEGMPWSPPTRENRFYPTVGNHDWQGIIKNSTNFTAAGRPLPAYFQYFGFLQGYLPPAASTVSSSGAAIGWGLSPHARQIAGFYSKILSRGLVELFCLNSNLGNPREEEPHLKLAAIQREWIQKALIESTAKWKIVFFHHPPYSTAQHDESAIWMRHPYGEWGADIVLSGHQHVYERMDVPSGPALQDPTAGGIGKAGLRRNLTYIINGLGGHPWVYEIHNCQQRAQGSASRYNAAHGAMLFQADETGLRLCFFSVAGGGSLVDSHTIAPRQ